MAESNSVSGNIDETRPFDTDYGGQDSLGQGFPDDHLPNVDNGFVLASHEEPSGKRSV